MTCDKWHMKNDTWHVTHDLWHVTSDTWQMTRHMWNMTCDMRGRWTFSQNVSSLALTVSEWRFIKDIFTNDDSLSEFMNLWMNDKGVCTAPATPGVKNVFISKCPRAPFYYFWRNLIHETNPVTWFNFNYPLDPSHLIVLTRNSLSSWLIGVWSGN